MIIVRTLLNNWVDSYRSRHRLQRSKTFLKRLHPSSQDKILDLGSGTGAHFFQVVKPGRNVFISDIIPELLSFGEFHFGYNTILLDANKPLKFKNKEFDIVFCNSLIEHVTGDKGEILRMDSTHFREYSRRYQLQIANEIRRVSKSYFVQTPYKYFPIESHTWMPLLFIFLPRSVQIMLTKFLNTFWIKKTYPDWNLLTIEDMQKLFPDAEIILEKSFGFVKSIMAIKQK